MKKITISLVIASLAAAAAVLPSSAFAETVVIVSAKNPATRMFS